MELVYVIITQVDFIGVDILKVVAFVGPSGTGKSYRSLWVAKQKDIDYIIDDGLLIGNSKIIAGCSAKKESTKISAIRRACFFDPEHISDVKNAIEDNKPNGIIIIATSIEMAESIRKKLGLEEISEIIDIKDIASKQEINYALKVRKSEGKHVIPVPTFELKKTFSGYFMDALNHFVKKGNIHFTSEKTIVRPAYSYLGKYTISDTVIKEITRHVILKVPNIYKVTSIDVENCDGSICITAYVIANYGNLNREVLKKLQALVREEIEKLTYMNVLGVNIVLKSLKV